jgi:hypothetical protein
LEFAVLLLLEKLSPSERAAFMLREAFNDPYQQIADILRLGEANVRQLATRARKHIADGRRTPVSAAEQRRLLVAFIAAAQQGDSAALERLLASDVVSCADGGGVVRAARVPVVGCASVAKFIAAIASHFWSGVTLAWIDANAQASVVILCDGAVVGLVTIAASAEGVDQILWVMRPSKLAAISRPWLASRALAVGSRLRYDHAVLTFHCRVRDSLSQNARASGHSWYLQPMARSEIGEHRSATRSR